MTTSRIATSETRLRPAFVGTLIAITFVVGIGAGFALSQVVAAHPGAVASVSVLPKAGADMSSAAYAAQHPNQIVALPKTGADMSTAAYAAQHPTAIRALPTAGADMSAAAYAAQHSVAPADMSAAAYAAMHGR